MGRYKQKSKAAGSKRCSCCGMTKAARLFQRDQDAASGLASCCKDCAADEDTGTARTVSLF